MVMSSFSEHFSVQGLQSNKVFEAAQGHSLEMCLQGAKVHRVSIVR